MPKQTKKAIDISGKVSKPKVLIPLSNPDRWVALRLLYLIKQIEAVAEIDPTKVNYKEYVMLLDRYADMNVKAAKAKRDKRNARDHKAEAVRQGVDSNDVAGGDAGSPPTPFTN
jgi:hypothetical protein